MTIEAVYMYLRHSEPGSVARTVDCGDDTYLDLDAQGRVLGIETIGHGIGIEELCAALMSFGETEPVAKR